MIQVPEAIKKRLWADKFKNYRLVFDDGSPDITNQNIIKESVLFEENTCSRDELKFGLCEGAGLQFEAFGIGDISEKTFDASIEVDCTGITPFEGIVFREDINKDVYPIPLGRFSVKSCLSKTSAAGIKFYKVNAFNKLQDKYLDADAKDLIQGMYSNKNLAVSFIDVFNILLADYGIIRTEESSIKIHQTSAWKALPVGFATKATVKYGINNPFSYLQMGANANYVWNCVCNPYVDIDPAKTYSISYLQNIEQYEQSLYDLIYKIVDEAKLTTSASAFLEAMMGRYSASYDGNVRTHNGWHNFIGIVLTKNDNSVEAYSTIAYLHECHQVVGTFSDLAKRTLYGYKRIDFYMPRFIALSSSISDPDQFLMNAHLNFCGPEGYGFMYYTDAALVDVRTSHYPTPPKNPDGSIHTYEDSETASMTVTKELSKIPQVALKEIIPSQMENITLRQAATAIYETVCQYGKLDRVTNMFSGEELNEGGLFPANELYPANDLYPNGADESFFRQNYTSLATGKQEKFKYLIVTYKTIEDGNEVEKTLQRTIHADGTTNYNMSDNWLFRNLIWTSEEIGSYADTMVEKMRELTWCKFSLKATGLPFIESGDMIEIQTDTGRKNTYILSRNLEGIQRLEDNYFNGSIETF